MEEEKITTMRLNKSTKEEFKKLKKYPRETDEDTLIRLIKKEVSKNAKDNKLVDLEDQEQDS